MMGRISMSCKLREEQLLVVARVPRVDSSEARNINLWLRPELQLDDGNAKPSTTAKDHHIYLLLYSVGTWYWMIR